MATKQQPHVALLAFPFASHVSVLLNLSCKLAAAAPDATFSFFSTAKTNASSFRSQAVNGLDNLKAYDVEDGIPAEKKHVFRGINLVEEVDLFIKATPHNFKKSVEMAVKETKKKISCVISDAFLWFGGEIAEEMKVPWIALWVPGPSSLLAHFHTQLIRQTIGVGVGDHKGREDEPLNFIAELSVLRVGDLPEGIISGNLESSFSCMLYKMSQMLTHVTTLIINTFEELDPSSIQNLKSKFQHCLSVGPLTLTCSSPPSEPDETGCLQWLDGQKPSSVAYIGFGTFTSPPPHELAALAQGLEESGVPFLWSLKDELKMNNLPDGFLARTSERGMVVPWAPQSRVLEHPSVGVYVTFCGWNSLLESINGGIPMIFRPFFADHMVNGRYVSDVWGIGLRAKDGVFSKAEMVRDLETILLKEEGKKMREKVELLRDLAKQAVGPNGSSTKNFNALLDIVTTATC